MISWTVKLTCLTLSWRRSLSYRNQSIHLLCKSIDWFLYEPATAMRELNDFCHLSWASMLSSFSPLSIVLWREGFCISALYKLILFFFCISHTMTIHGTVGEGRGHLYSSLLLQLSHEDWNICKFKVELSTAYFLSQRM